MVSLEDTGLVDRLAVTLIAVFAVGQLAVLTEAWSKPLLWDSSVYLAMGKWLFSLGDYGFWENFRPPVLPLLTGLWWKAGLPFESLRLLSTGIATAGLAAVYRMSGRLFGKTEALFATGILAASHTYFFFSLNPLTGILASILVFAGLYLVEAQRYTFAGVVLSVAFLTRFPAAIAGPAAVLYIVLEGYSEGELREAVENSARLTAGFFTVDAAYLAVQYWFFGSMLSPFLRSASITAGAGSKYLYGLAYFVKMVKAGPLMALIPLGIYAVLRGRKWKYGGFLVSLLLFYGFFTLFPLKIARYTLLFLPLASLFAGHAAASMMDRVELDRSLAFRAAVLLLAGLVAWNALNGYKAYNWDAVEQQQFFSSVSGLDGDVVASNEPRVNLYGDFRYHPTPPSELSELIQQHGSEIDHWAINGRYWDCRGYPDCEENIAELESYLERNYVVSSKILAGSHNYTIYSRR
ncbi:MAG: glycosyltransferase family 39 protein [Candidatus Nanohaloarchaea archaeon]